MNLCVDLRLKLYCPGVDEPCCARQEGEPGAARLQETVAGARARPRQETLPGAPGDPLQEAALYCTVLYCAPGDPLQEAVLYCTVLYCTVPQVTPCRGSP